MGDLISRKALLEKAWEADTQCGYVQVVDVGDIEDAPAVDAAPVVHGEWIVLDECANEGVYCSVCRKKIYKIDYARSNNPVKMKSQYCPNCGAKMNGGNDNDCQRGDCSF